MKINLYIFFIGILCLFSCRSTNNTGDNLELVHIDAISNPERGFNLESNYFIHNLVYPWRERGTYPYRWIPEMKTEYDAQTDGVTLTQLYLYLTEYVGKDIDSLGFENMQMLFDSARESGYKVHLTFAYDYTPYATKVTFEDIFRHLEQLKPFIERNIGLIDIWKMGFIGAWGEGHSTPMQQDWENKSKLISKILETYPQRYMSLRYPREMYKFSLTQEEQKHVGFSNDYFTASEHPLAPENDYTFGSLDYEMVAQAGPYVKVCGEIPYAENTKWGLHELISIPNTIRILKEHHYDSFDITQNHDVNIPVWKSYRISPQWCRENGILYDESYFVENGKKVTRSAYEFIRDHLGYRLYVDKPVMKKEDATLEFDIPLRNSGFSAIVNPRPVYIVLIDKTGNVAFKQKIEASPKDWHPYDPAGDRCKMSVHHIKGSVTPRLKGKYMVGLWLPDPTESLEYIPDYAVRFANTEIFENSIYRINIIGKIKL